eukprot:3832153-Pleurochrysis_carterae.AAC.1
MVDHSVERLILQNTYEEGDYLSRVGNKHIYLNVRYWLVRIACGRWHDRMPQRSRAPTDTTSTQAGWPLHCLAGHTRC